MDLIKRTISLIICAALLLSLCGCTTYRNFHAAFFENKSDEDVIKIGVLEPQTGGDSNASADEITGMQIANELFPSIGDVKLELVYSDNQSDITAASSAAQYLIDSGCLAVLGSYKSTLTLASSETLKKAGVPAVGASCTNPLVTSTSEWYFRVCFVEAYEGKYAALYAKNYLNAEKVAVLVPEGNDVFESEAEQFVKSFYQLASGNDEDYDEAVASEYVYYSEYPQDTVDFTPYFRLIHEKGISIIFCPALSKNANTIVQAAYSAGFNFSWIGNSYWDGIDQIESEDKLHLEGISYIVDYDALAEETENGKLLRAAYQEKFGSDELPNQNAALGFDAYLVLYNAIQLAGTDGDTFNEPSREMIREKLAETSNISGATGNISFDEAGDPEKEVSIERYSNGSIGVVYTIGGEMEQ